MFNKANPASFMVEYYPTLFPTCYTPSFASIEFIMIVMMMTLAQMAINQYRNTLITDTD